MRVSARAAEGRHWVLAERRFSVRNVIMRVPRAVDLPRMSELEIGVHVATFRRVQSFSFKE